jgi:hypothetical protein
MEQYASAMACIEPGLNAFASLGFALNRWEEAQFL